MFRRELGVRGWLGGKAAGAVIAMGLVAPGAFIALTPSPAAAQGSDPLGPTVAQVEALVNEAIATAQSYYNTAVSGVGTLLCLAPVLLSVPPLGGGPPLPPGTCGLTGP